MDIVALILIILFVVFIGGVIWNIIPRRVRCRWGYHEWMDSYHPYWGGEEQRTYCCDLCMKIERTYDTKRKMVSKRRVPFTKDDFRKKAERIEDIRKTAIQREFYSKLIQDMKSDDACEELLP